MLLSRTSSTLIANKELYSRGFLCSHLAFLYYPVNLFCMWNQGISQIRPSSKYTNYSHVFVATQAVSPSYAMMTPPALIKYSFVTENSTLTPKLSRVEPSSVGEKVPSDPYCGKKNVSVKTLQGSVAGMIQQLFANYHKTKQKKKMLSTHRSQQLFSLLQSSGELT